MTSFSASYVFLGVKKQVQVTTELDTPKEAKANQLNNKKNLIIAKHGEKLQRWHLSAIINSLADFKPPSGPHVD